MRKAVIHNRMAVDILTTCAIIKVECCVYIPDLSDNVLAALDDMKNQVKQCQMKTFLSGLRSYLG